MGGIPGGGELFRDCAGNVERQRVLAANFYTWKPHLQRLVEVRFDRRLRRRVDASDVLQETFLEASRRLDEYLSEPHAPLFLWLKFLALQQVLAMCRKHMGAKTRDLRREVSSRSRQGSPRSALLEGTEVPARQPSPSEAAIQAERRTGIHEALDGTPEARDLVADLLRSGKVLRERLERLTEEEAARPFPRKMPDGSTTVGGAAHFLLSHESYHVGQIGILRRMLGKPGFA